MERTFISWTVENWITVLLMAGLGYGLFVLVDQLLIQKLPIGGQTRVAA